MYAVEFEADVTSPFIQLQNYEQFMNQHVKVIVLAQEAPKTIKMGDATYYVKKLRERHFKPTTSMNVDTIMSDMNNGLS